MPAADVIPSVRAVAPQHIILKDDFAAVRPVQPSQHIQEGRLSASRWSEQANEPPFRKFQGGVVNGMDFVGSSAVEIFVQIFRFTGYPRSSRQQQVLCPMIKNDLLVEQWSKVDQTHEENPAIHRLPSFQNFFY